MTINKLVTFLLSAILLNNVVQSMEYINKPNGLKIKQNEAEVNLATQESILDEQILKFAKEIQYNNDNFQIKIIKKFFDNMFYDL